MQIKKIFVEKYAAKSLKDFLGHEEAILLIKKFIINFRKGKKACIIHGPSGSGKTSLVYAIASELGFEVVELNASNFRSGKDIENILKKASEQRSLFSKSKVILVDELEGISGKDRGGVSALEGLILESQCPIFLTANDIWQKKFNSLRQKCELVQLKEANYNLISLFLEKICKNENIKVSRDVLIKLAIKEKGDFRASLNDLQVLSSGTDAINSEDIDKIIVEREKDEGIFNALQLIFKSNKLEPKILNAYENLNMNLDDVWLWLDENIPKEYGGIEIANAYNYMGKADVFKRRIMRQQHWGFLVYQNLFLTAGISVSKNSAKSGFTKYQKPSRILKIWMVNQKKEKIKSISSKYARFTHCSAKRAMKEFEIIKIILKNNNMQELNLEEDEKEFILA